ncbi:replication protein RepA [Pseudoroseomonas cervicalis]|uniref:replication protein RepA n=1 Tax=Teichococcus cervicalis TaxID=204525 RepID=UPI0022F17128|nr:replication protein RepA [Pseudoroseomonas cervicalis]WBV45091.1 replication protein RepA [Pseudoroseomonas cervicalis]
MEEVRSARRLVEEHGRLGAIARHEDRRLVEIIASYGADEDVGIPNFLYSGWCMTALPHSRIADDKAWRLENGNVVLLVEPGRRALPGEADEWIGVPFGPTARLIMIYLQSEALRTNSRNIELGRSMNEWFGRMDKKAGGKSYKLVRQQAERIATCRFSFHAERDGVRAIRNQSIVDEGLLFLDGREQDSRQQSLFQEGVVLSESFFRSLKEHAVPVEERAIRHISNSSMAIDTYCWLAYRLHSLKRPTPISWAALHSQFGSGYGQVAAFKRAFLSKILPSALAVYPEAGERGVEVSDTGLILKPTRPPILSRHAA